jgi:hypothetical protein
VLDRCSERWIAARRRELLPTRYLHVVFTLPSRLARLVLQNNTRWVRSRDNYFLPKKVLSEVFRGKFVNALEQAFQHGQLNFQGNLKLLAQPKIFAAWLRPLYRQDWVVYLKRPFWWSPICAAISGPLHPSRGHL